MKKIILLSILTLVSMKSYSNVTVVSGVGSASCPSGYVVTGMVVKNLNYPSMNWGDQLESASFTGCSSATTTKVSGCKSLFRVYWDTTSDSPRRSNVTRTPTISIYCAKSCGN